MSDLPKPPEGCTCFIWLWVVFGKSEVNLNIEYSVDTASPNMKKLGAAITPRAAITATRNYSSISRFPFALHITESATDVLRTADNQYQASLYIRFFFFKDAQQRSVMQ